VGATCFCVQRGRFEGLTCRGEEAKADDDDGRDDEDSGREAAGRREDHGAPAEGWGRRARRCVCVVWGWWIR